MYADTLRDPRLMAEQLPPDWPNAVPGVGWLVASVGVGATIFKLISDWLTGRATRAKLEAERATAETAQQTSLIERETQEVLGVKAYEELRNAQMLGVAEMLKTALLMVDDLKAQVQTERDTAEVEAMRSRRFRSAVLEFVALVTSVMPDMRQSVRERIGAGLEKLHNYDVWET